MTTMSKIEAHPTNTQDATAELRRPADWADALGLTIHDPGGWRGQRAKDFNEPVTAEEFDSRAGICTISFHSNTFHNELPKATRLINGENA